MNIGFIKLNREILSWEWYEDSNTFKMFMHCLLKANFKQKKWCGIKINKGQFITSNEKLSTESGLSVSQVRTSLKKLADSEYIKAKGHSKYTVITISEEFYEYLNIEQKTRGNGKLEPRYISDFSEESMEISQTNSQTNGKDLTIKTHPDSIQLTTTKKEKEIKNLKNDNKENFRKEVFQLSQFPEKNLKAFFEYYVEEDDSSKMRFESFTYWNTESRVKKWMQNERQPILPDSSEIFKNR